MTTADISLRSELQTASETFMLQVLGIYQRHLGASLTAALATIDLPGIGEPLSPVPATPAVIAPADIEVVRTKLAQDNRPTRTFGEKRSREEIATVGAQVVKFITNNPGLRVEQINDALGTRTIDLALPLKQRIAAGEIHIKGARRATTYWPGKGTVVKKTKAKSKAKR